VNKAFNVLQTHACSHEKNLRQCRHVVLGNIIT